MQIKTSSYTFIDYELIKSEPLSNHTNGVDVLETSSDEILRGLVFDPAVIGNYPDDVRIDRNWHYSLD